MEKNIRNQIWPEYTSKWFKSEHDSSVPHNFDTANIKANDSIKQYLRDNGLLISSNWVPDKTFHEHFKRWVGYCSAPYHTLQDNTPTQPFYMSFFPFVFEVASAFFLGKFNSYITQPFFLENGDSIVINPKEPKVVQLCLKGILDRLLRFEDPKYGFIYLVLINNNNQSNIDAMKIEESGEFWVRLKIGLTDQVIEKINDRYACVTNDRAMKIQELRTYLASDDSYVQLDVENRGGSTFLVFKNKASEEPNSQESSKINSGKEKKPMNDKETAQENKKEGNGKPEPDNKQASINHGPVIYGGNFTNVVMGDHAKQINYSKSDDE